MNDITVVYFIGSECVSLLNELYTQTWRDEFNCIFHMMIFMGCVWAFPNSSENSRSYYTKAINYLPTTANAYTHIEAILNYWPIKWNQGNFLYCMNCFWDIYFNYPKFLENDDVFEGTLTFKNISLTMVLWWQLKFELLKR